MVVSTAFFQLSKMIRVRSGLRHYNRLRFLRSSDPWAKSDFPRVGFSRGFAEQHRPAPSSGSRGRHASRSRSGIPLLGVSAKGLGMEEPERCASPGRALTALVFFLRQLVSAQTGTGTPLQERSELTPARQTSALPSRPGAHRRCFPRRSVWDPWPADHGCRQHAQDRSLPRRQGVPWY